MDATPVWALFVIRHHALAAPITMKILHLRPLLYTPRRASGRVWYKVDNTLVP